VRRILALVGGHGDKTSLLSRQRTTTWTRKKVVMTKLMPTKGGVDEVAEGLSNLERPQVASSGGDKDRSAHAAEERWSWMSEHWEREWMRSLTRTVRGGGRLQLGDGRSMKASCHRLSGDWAGARAVTGDWVPRTGIECERARGEDQLRLQDAIQNDTFEDFMQDLRERGHVGLANEGLRIWRAGREPTPGVDLNDMRDRMCVWRGWMDWEVRMVRPQLQANVSTWNMVPLGYEASKAQLRKALCEGRAVLMVQELCFLLGAHRRVKRELNALHPDYFCILETGKESLMDDCWDTTARAVLLSFLPQKRKQGGRVTVNTVVAKACLCPTCCFQFIKDYPRARRLRT